MKTLNPAPVFMFYCIVRSIRHPKQPIEYYYCSNCKTRFPASSSECPKCHDKVESSPDPRRESSVPWYGSIGVIILGITCWILGAIIPVAGLDEAGRALVYLPLGHLFGMSLQKG